MRILIRIPPGSFHRDLSKRQVTDSAGLKAMGVNPPDAERIIEFAIEVTRATLATLPVDRPGRDEVLEELEEKIAGYLVTRLNLPSQDAP